MGWLLSNGKGHFWTEFGGPIVSNGDFRRSCGKLRESIDMSFGVVSGVDRGMGVHVPQGRGLLGFFFSIIVGV